MYKVKFKNKKLNKEKLVSFGFEEHNGSYYYYTDLLDGQMRMNITVLYDGNVSTEVIDNNSGEEYILHNIADATGAFVGQVKAEYDAVLEEISSKCFETDVFKSEQAKRLIQYVREKYGDELEFLWMKFSDNAIWRRKDTNKWYAALLIVSKRKLGIDSDKTVEILDLRIKPEKLDELLDNKKYFAGYHMNKKHWYTICLDDSVSFEEICERVAISYTLALK